MLRNHLEEVVWGTVYALNYHENIRKCYPKASAWAKEQVPKIKPKDARVQKRWEYEEKLVAQEAAEHADCAVLNLREHELTNEDNPSQLHVADMTKYLTKHGDLDLDSYDENYDEVV